MNFLSNRKIGLGVLAVFVAVGALAQDIPLKNWTVPQSSPDSFRKAVDATPPRAFIGLPPCRILDTRGNAAPIQGGIYGNAESRNYTVTGICGIPVGADDVSVNFTVLGAPAAPPGAFLLAFPEGGVPPPTSILNYQTQPNPIANAAIVPLSAGGGMTVNVSHSVHIIMDVNGYFSDMQGSPANFFRLEGNVPFADAVMVADNSNTGGSAAGIIGRIISSAPGAFSAGVRGINNGTGGDGIGVYGSQAGGGWGVYGTSVSGLAVYGSSGSDFGVFGDTATTTNEEAAVRGQALGGTGRTYGVYGSTASTDLRTAGVFGQVEAFFSGDTVGNPAFGVLGHARNGTGVFGESLTRGVNGCRDTIAANVGIGVACGVVGFTGTSGVHSFQDVTAGGIKPFVVPYEGDPTKQIVYIATEADQALTSTRGRVKLDRGLATIRVPEHFLKVTEEEGWSVHLTPIGEMATLAVLRIDAERGEVVIKGSRSVEAFYRIEGVRRGYAGFNPVQENIYFVPDSAKAKMDPWPEQTKRMLIANGIYNADGTPNLETAERLGWKKVWDQREEESRAAAKPESKPTQE